MLMEKRKIKRYCENPVIISCTILLISFLYMFIKEEKEEHPEIMEEEQEIRDNLKNNRKEARDVEHILEDDIRSQIEKK